MPGPLDALLGGGGPPGGGGAPGGPPDAGGGGNPMDGIMKFITSLQQSPPPDGEDQMLNQASMLINQAYGRIVQRSAKSAKALAEANVKIQSAREALKAEASRPQAGAPDMGMGMGMQPMLGTQGMAG